MGYELNDFHNFDNVPSFEDQILKDLEGVFVEVIVGALHHKMAVISSPQFIISLHVPIDFINEHPLS